MNERLKFSWGHIIAFLAIICVSYISFMGITYLTNGDFNYALIGMGIIDFFFILFFIGAQQFKASGVKMKRKMALERIFLLCSIVVFLIGMIPMAHFWTVKSQNDEIVDQFTSSISNAHNLFVDYEKYSNDRINNYEKELTQVIENKDIEPRAYHTAGFIDGKAEIQKENMVKTLRLQLLSENYDSLKTLATKWIDESNQGASTWNVFLLGNTKEIKKSIGSWDKQLKDFSAYELSNEVINKAVPKFNSKGATDAISGIDQLTSAFTTKKFSIIAIPFGIIVYLMLIFPYIIQSRHSKSPYKNIFKKKVNNGFSIKTEKSEKDTDDGTFRIN